MMSSGKLTTGTILVVTGVLILLNNLGIVDWTIWWNLVSLWPVLLIAWGIGLLFRGTRLALLGPLTILVALGYAIATPGRPIHPWVEWSFGDTAWDSGEAVFSRAPKSGVDSLKMVIDFGAGNLRVNGGSSNLYDANLEYHNSIRPRETFDVAGNVARGRLYQRGNIVGPQTWNVQLTSEQKVDLDVNAGACKAVLDLSMVRLATLSVDCGASSVEVSMGKPQGLTPVSMNSGASSIKVMVPRGSAIRVRMDSALVSNNIRDLGLEHVGKYWMTPGYDGSDASYDIHISSGVGSIELEYSDPTVELPNSGSQGV